MINVQCGKPIPVDKKQFNNDDIIGLKNPDKPFPVSKYFLKKIV